MRWVLPLFLAVMCMEATAQASGFVFTPSLQSQHDLAWAVTDPAGKERADYRLRRQRIGVSGRIVHDVGYRFSVEFSTARKEAEIRDAYLSYRGLPNQYFAAGFTREANGIYEKASNVGLPFMERPVGLTTFQSIRNYGVIASPHTDQWTLQLGGYGTGTGNTGDRDDGWGVSGRAVWRPWLDMARHQVLHLGMNGRYRNPGIETLRFRANGEEAVLQDPLVDTGVMAGVEDVYNLAGEVYYTDGPLAFLAEARRSQVARGVGFSDPVFWGGTAQVTYFLTGEQREYQVIGGTFGRISPRVPVSEGGVGAWEAGLRLDALDLQDEDITGGQLYSASLGMSWWPEDYLRLMANYVVNEVDNSPITTENPQYFLFRVQAAF